VEKVGQFEKEFLNFVDNNFPDIVDSIRETKDLTDDNAERIVEAITEFKKSF
jgi:F-type H+-transporting ATPase subunit alpha